MTYIYCTYSFLGMYLAVEYLPSQSATLFALIACLAASFPIGGALAGCRSKKQFLISRKKTIFVSPLRLQPLRLSTLPSFLPCCFSSPHPRTSIPSQVVVTTRPLLSQRLVEKFHTWECMRSSARGPEGHLNNKALHMSHKMMSSVSSVISFILHQI